MRNTYWQGYGMGLLLALASMASATAEDHRYDFGEAGSTPSNGYTRLSLDDAHTRETGRGFVLSQTNKERGWRRRGRLSDASDTFVFDGGGLTFVQDVPEGVYRVVLASGDAQYEGSVCVAVNGEEVLPLIETTAGKVLVLTVWKVRPVEGRITIDVGGHGRLNHLEIAPQGQTEQEEQLTVSLSLDPDYDHILANGNTPVVLGESEFETVDDRFGPVYRVNLPQVEHWPGVPGVKRRWPITGPDGEKNAANAVVSNIKDVDNDGQLDLFRVVSDEPGRVARFTENGELVWRSADLAPSAGDESGMPVVDLDNDGTYECVLSQRAELYCIDAQTGTTKWNVTTGEPHPKWDYPMAVGHFTDTDSLSIVVRAGLEVHCYDAEGQRQWAYEFPSGQDDYGHELHVYDVTGDGYDEIFIGLNRRSVALKKDGTALWEDETQLNHTDFFQFGDVDEDGRVEVLYDHDGCGRRGPIYLVDGATGKKELEVDYRQAGIGHAQGITLGDFRPDIPGLEFACTDKALGVALWDAAGNLLWMKETPTSLISRGDWDGDGTTDLLVFTIGVHVEPAFSVWNGHGERLYAISFLPSPMRSHAIMCGPLLGQEPRVDIDGNGKADVLMAFGPWRFGAPQNLFLMEAE